MTDCAYCSDEAVGIDDEGEYTCGSTHCTPVVQPLPDVMEVSGDDNEDDALDAEEE